ncbi:aromatic ring-hydroxylating dioxygenase subunit alpha [Motiliproteus sp. MSK22-1]|uniref:aromatic ring-hydroxylating oxygenase subunit alpha n=1 Tax=Motiliproteus sp. MSK22-1 TaxID=1897630 RepID=UPI000976CB56|nr:aromatic ring-hydroxylating dioxygenase subunit alpha [Motiliproteus sp. MSK22-1]OMH30536.1 Rieske (2Fe-2S) protein [Motiliproteus sp. MSK22-1]
MNEHDLLNIKYNSYDQARNEMHQLLDERAGNLSLPQPFYNDPHMFRADMEEIFQQEWIFVGMSSEVPAKGDYFTVEIGQNPVLVVRDAEGGIKAFHNVCRHRGSKICREHRGKVANLVCPYHQWTYDLQGNLLYAGTEMGDDFDMKAHGLKPAHCRTAGGFVFISLAEGEAPDLDPFLESLEAYMEPYDMENTKVAVESNILEDANWKLVIENNRECYHCAGNHPELLNTLLEWDDTNDPRASEEFLAQYNRQAEAWDAEGIPHKHVEHGLRNRIVRMPLKEGAQVMTLDGSQGCKKMMGRIKNRELGSMRILHLPNSWNHMQGDHAVVFRVLPISAQKTLVTTKWLVHKDAVEGVDYDPAKLRQVWDATNEQDRRLAEENQQGINSIGYQPGPYSETFEFGVINFIDWYSETVRDNLKKRAL